MCFFRTLLAIQDGIPVLRKQTYVRPHIHTNLHPHTHTLSFTGICTGAFVISGGVHRDVRPHNTRLTLRQECFRFTVSLYLSLDLSRLNWLSSSDSQFFRSCWPAIASFPFKRKQGGEKLCGFRLLIWQLALLFQYMLGKRE